MEPTAVNIFIVGLLAGFVTAGIIVLITKIPKYIRVAISAVVQYIGLILVLLTAIYMFGVLIFILFQL